MALLKGLTASVLSRARRIPQDDALRRRDAFSTTTLTLRDASGRAGGATSLGRRSGCAPRQPIILGFQNISSSARVCWSSTLSC